MANHDDQVNNSTKMSESGKVTMDIPLRGNRSLPDLEGRYLSNDDEPQSSYHHNVSIDYNDSTKMGQKRLSALNPDSYSQSALGTSTKRSKFPKIQRKSFNFEINPVTGNPV